MITAYSFKNGQVIKTPVGDRLRESYDSLGGKDHNEATLRSYYRAECDGLLKGRYDYLTSRRVADRIKAIHNLATEQGR